MKKAASLQNSAQKTSGELARISQKESGIDQARPLHPLLYLQQSIGNQAVLHLLKSGALQTKPKINQPGDVYEKEADGDAEQVMRSSDGVVRGISDGPPKIQKKCEACASGQGTCTKRAEEEEEIIQRKPLAPAITPLIQRQVKEPPTARAVTPSPGLIVEDEAEDVKPGQMRKSEFLSELKTSVCSTAEEALSGTIWSAMGCPYIERWFEHYSYQDSQHVERALRKYAPETASARTARQYIPIVTQRVRRGIKQWAETGEVTGVPEEFAKGGMPGVTAAGLIGGVVSGALSAVGSAVSGLVSGVGQAVSGIGRALFKKREGGAREAGDPRAIQSQLSSGHPLDSGVKSRMGSAFGVDFSGVRIHTDSKAVELSDSLNARAFTIGSDIAFGSGEYQPRTPIGDALIAHELAHVVQQGGGNGSGAPMQKGDRVYNSLEEDADVSAVGAVVSVWGGMKGSLTDISTNAVPRMRSGLRLQRCAARRPAAQLPRGEERAKAPATTGKGAAAKGCKYSVNYANPKESDCETVFKEEGKKPPGPLCGKRVIYEIVSVTANDSSCPLEGLEVSENVASIPDTHSCHPPGSKWPPPSPCITGPGGKLTGCTDTLTICGPTSELHYGGCEENVTQDILVDGKTVEKHTITFELDVSNNICTTTVTRK